LCRNPKLLNGLPNPLMSLATHQMSGRGRGGNIWLSPAGCLQFSILLKVSSSPGSSPYPYLRPSSLVFIQYLMGMAVVIGCRPLLGPHGGRVRLKWPNDIYGVSGGVKKKLGGIIVTTVFSEGIISIIIGKRLKNKKRPY
jgi:biotin---protein ligase